MNGSGDKQNLVLRGTVFTLTFVVCSGTPILLSFVTCACAYTGVLTSALEASAEEQKGSPESGCVTSLLTWLLEACLIPIGSE